jgi:hypothetical protein
MLQENSCDPQPRENRRSVRLCKIHRRFITFALGITLFFALASVALFGFDRTYGGWACAVAAVTFFYLAFWCYRHEGTVSAPPIELLKVIGNCLMGRKP